MTQLSDPRDTLANLLIELSSLRNAVENHSTGDYPRWPDLEALLRVTAAEAARMYEREGQTIDV